MWPKAYKNYPVDTDLIKEQIETGKGIIGCEMHELNGWGNTFHVPRRVKKRNLIEWLLQLWPKR